MIRLIRGHRTPFTNVKIGVVDTSDVFAVPYLGLRRLKANPDGDPNFRMESGNAAFFITKF